MRPELDVKAIVDGSKMSAAQRQALEVCEAACEVRREPCFAASLLVGEPDFSMLKNRQPQSLEERDQGEDEDDGEDPAERHEDSFTDSRPSWRR